MVIFILAAIPAVILLALMYAFCQTLRRQHEEMDKWTRR